MKLKTNSTIYFHVTKLITKNKLYSKQNFRNRSNTCTSKLKELITSKSKLDLQKIYM